MSKSSSIFVCQSCGAHHPKWSGQCVSCGEWNTLVEELKPTTPKGLKNETAPATKPLDPKNVVAFSRVDLASASKRRFSTQIGELDRVLGGGLVPGAVILIGGEPGIGKSTLLTQMVLLMLSHWLGHANSAVTDGARVARSKKAVSAPSSVAPETISETPGPILYVCGEESPSQITLRIKRIIENEHIIKNGYFVKDLGDKISEHLLFVTTTDTDEVITAIVEKQPSLVIIDSIQTMQTTDLTGAEGSVGQIRESTQRLTDIAKRLQLPIFLVGHVTKEGTIAGPKVLEHIVDSVVELTGERTGQLRLLRAIKNRFGATDEVGVFKLVEYGLEEVTNPSELFLEHTTEPVPGSATVCVLEGTRPLLVEVQALVISSQLAMPRRVGRGIELNRIQVLAAVLQKHAHLPLGTTDIFLSAAGGFTVREPAVDLGLAVAAASSLKGKALPVKTVFIGEVGLLGEIRSVSYLDQRVKEAKRLGFTNIISRQTHTRVRDVLKELGLI